MILIILNISSTLNIGATNFPYTPYIYSTVDFIIFFFSNSKKIDPAYKFVSNKQNEKVLITLANTNNWKQLNKLDNWAIVAFNLKLTVLNNVAITVRVITTNMHFTLFID